MKQLNFLLLYLIINLLHNSALCQNDSIVALTELQRMNNVFGYRIKMNVTREGRNESLPNQNIQISLDELKQISTTPRKDLRFYIIRFIVAHEFAHQIQYQRYTNDRKFFNNDNISKTLLETQAEIMAGFIFIEMSPELMSYQLSHPELVDAIFRELFVATHKIGIRENTLGSHPSKRDRMLAVRLGLTKGISFAYDKWVKLDINRAIQAGLTPEIFKNQMEDQFRFIDFNNKEDLVSWSYRQAKKIVNYDRKIATGIVLLTPYNERIFWHTETTYPYVDYNLTYKNISNKSIDVEMEVFVAHVDRIESSSPENYRKINVDHYKFSLLPGQTKNIQGKLMWLKRENDTLVNLELKEGNMPRIVYPGIASEDAIYSCSYSNDSSNQVYQGQIANLRFKSPTDVISFRSFLLSILNVYEFAQDAQDAIMGIGEINEKYPDEVTYVSSYQFDDETLTLVTIDSLKKITQVDLFFPNYQGATTMLSNYSDMKSQLSLDLADSKIEEGQIGENIWISYSSDSYDVSLQTIKNERANEYSIKLSIYF